MSDNKRLHSLALKLEGVVDSDERNRGKLEIRDVIIAVSILLARRWLSEPTRETYAERQDWILFRTRSIGPIILGIIKHRCDKAADDADRFVKRVQTRRMLRRTGRAA